jgi:hypothetical protein
MKIIMTGAINANDGEVGVSVKNGVLIEMEDGVKLEFIETDWERRKKEIEKLRRERAVEDFLWGIATGAAIACGVLSLFWGRLFP